MDTTTIVSIAIAAVFLIAGIAWFVRRGSGSGRSGPGGRPGRKTQ